MWRPRPGKPGPGKLAASVARGHPSAPQGQAPSVRATRGLAPLLPLAGCGVGAPARPGPHDVGAVGPSAPPARAAALRPALPARPRLRRRPCRAALPAHSPHGVAAPRGSCFGAPPARTKPPLGRSPPCGRLAHCAACAACSARAVRGPQSIPPRALAAQAPPSRASRAAGRRERRLRAGCRPVSRPARPRQAPCRPGQPGHDQRPCLPVSRAAWETVAGVPACAGSPPVLHSVFGGVLLVCAVFLSFCRFFSGCFLPASLWLWCLCWRLCRGLPGRSLLSCLVACGGFCWPLWRFVPVGFCPCFPVAVCVSCRCGFGWFPCHLGRLGLARWCFLWPCPCCAVSVVRCPCSCVGWLLSQPFFLGKENPLPGNQQPGQGILPASTMQAKNSNAEVTQGYESERTTGAAPVGGFLVRSQISFHSVEESALPAE